MLFQDTLDGPLHIFELENARIVQWQALLRVPRRVAETFQTTEAEYRKGWVKESSVNALLFITNPTVEMAESLLLKANFRLYV